MKDRASRGSAILMGAWLLVSSACAQGIGSTTDLTGANDKGGAVSLNVTNLSGGPMEIYASGGGTSYRVGTVLPGLSGKFEVRPVMTVGGAVEFSARSAHGPFFRSGPMLLSPGAVVDFRIEESGVLSTATVRP